MGCICSVGSSLVTAGRLPSGPSRRAISRGDPFESRESRAEYVPRHADRYLNVHSREAVTARMRSRVRVPSHLTTTPGASGPPPPGRSSAFDEEPSVSALFGLSLIGIFCLLGMALRRWVRAFRTNMVPAFVIAGFLGAIAMNIGLSGALEGVDHELFTALTAQLFTLSFISIGLTPPPPSTRDDGGRTQKVLLRGARAMGLTWTLVFAVQALIGVTVVATTGRFGGMDAIYGFMVPFAFAQGPGQAVTFAGIFEQQGWADAVNVGLAFASAGFAAAFLVGVPLAKWGMSRGLATHSMGISDSVGKGYFREEEETESMGTETTFSGNLDTLTFHFAMMGLAYLLAHGLAWIFGHLPGFVGDTLSGMMFMNGLIAAYVLRWVLRKIRLEHLLDRQMQAKLTGFTTDYVVVASFMAVQAAVVAAWLVPILVTVVLVTAATVALCFAIGQRYGSDHDFE